MSSLPRVAIVTGGGSGIGRAVALALAQEGYSVVVAGRSAGTLEAAVAESTSFDGQMLAIATDVRDPSSVTALFARIADAFGRVDLLFNNAGAGAPAGPIEHLTYEQWRLIIDTNITGTFLCTQEAIKMMKSQQPRGGTHYQ